MQIALPKTPSSHQNSSTARRRLLAAAAARRTWRTDHRFSLHSPGWLCDPIVIRFIGGPPDSQAKRALERGADLRSFVSGSPPAALDLWLRTPIWRMEDCMRDLPARTHERTEPGRRMTR